MFTWRLYGWYNAIAQYTFENKRKLFGSAMLYPHNNANGADVDGMSYPNTAWGNRNQNTDEVLQLPIR